MYLSPLRDYGLFRQNLLSADSKFTDAIVAAYVEALELGFKVRLPNAEHVPCPYCEDKDDIRASVIGPDGTLYSCWDVAGRQEFGVGTVTSGYDIEPSKWQMCNHDVLDHRTIGLAMDQIHACRELVHPGLWHQGLIKG